MNKCECDKCGHEFPVNLINYEEIRRGDIIVEYFRCPACLAKYHICTTNLKMRKLIKQRLDIQNKIAEGHTNPMKAGKAHNLQQRLNRILAKQKELVPKLKKRGEKILKESETDERR